MSDTILEQFVARAKNNYDRFLAEPQNMAHVDQGAAMWRQAFAENGLPLDPITARVVIFALGMCGARAATQLPDETGDLTVGQMVNWACTEAATYVVPALGEMPNLEDIVMLDPDIEITWKWDYPKIARWVGAGVFAVTSAVLAWRDRG